MKNIVLALVVGLFSLVFLLKCSTHEKKENLVQWDYKLKGKSYKEFRAIKDNWMRINYRKILKKYSISLNCSNCEYAYIIVILNIADNGSVTEVSFVDSNVCGKKASAKIINDFVDYFKKVLYPPSLRGKKVKTRIGGGLKC